MSNYTLSISVRNVILRNAKNNEIKKKQPSLQKKKTSFPLLKPRSIAKNFWLPGIRKENVKEERRNKIQGFRDFKLEKEIV